MYSCLSPGAIGVKVASLEDSLNAAQIGGFGGVEISPAEIAERVKRDGVTSIVEMFEKSGVKPGGFGLPVDWRGDEAKWRQDLERLPELAEAAASIGCTRTFTWILPGSDSLEYEENRSFHIARFTPVARILQEFDCSLGLEFIGPKTSLDHFRFPFIHTSDSMLNMAAEIGDNVGLLLDCWHWYTSHGTIQEIEQLRAEQVVYVHVNDAPAGIPVDEQLDNVRALPAQTGVIPIDGFMTALRSIGYNGPVTPEPFASELQNYSSDAERLTVVGSAMKKIM